MVEKIAIDPVCGMAVDRERSTSLEREGRLVFFCSRGCRDEFLGVRTMDEAARAEELVRRVLDQPELLHAAFQPIVSLGTGEVVGYEALARFAPVPLQLPEAWFDLAAKAGLTPELEALALRTALAIVERRPPPADTFVSVNISPLLLDDPRIASPLAGPAVPPGSIVIELTERDRVGDYDALRVAVAPYRARGFRIAVDDAGAGYASLRHITELTPEFVKLDARLIRGLTGDVARQALVRAMTTFVDEIGAVLVAEGVEQSEDLDLLVRTGRPMLIQGYAVGGASEPWPGVSDLAVRHLGRSSPASELGAPVSFAT
jgi:EAL domain-containing protein (putative c-di-GMP-specific phosphodiesterase class I)/YHS domain-containing protein